MMTPEEVAGLLAIIVACDPRRKYDAGDVTTWQHLIGDLPFTECRDAIVEHYKSSAYPVMPSEVRNAVRAVRRRRLERVVQPPPPFDPETQVEAGNLWKATWNENIAAGDTPDTAMDRATRRVEDALNVEATGAALTRSRHPAGRHRRLRAVDK
jgi:hypothetical protein